MPEDPFCMVSLDLGTTHLKVFAFSDRGQTLLKAEADTPYDSDGRQHASAVFSVCLQMLNGFFDALSQKNILARGMAISGAMHSLVLLSAEMKELAPAWLWNDNDGAAEAEKLHENGQAKKLFAETGTPVHAMSPMVKLVWLGLEKKALFDSAAYFISIKEYIYFNLTGQRKTDWSIASASGMFSPATLDYSVLALELTRTRRERFFEPVSPLFGVGLLPVHKKKWNLQPDFQIIIGASDGCLATLGAAPLREGNVSMSMGTSAAIRCALPEFKTEPDGKLFTYMLDETHFVTGGPSNNAGAVFNWFTQLFSEAHPSAADFEKMIVKASSVSAGADGLVFEPWLFGERAPYWNSSLTAAFKNLNHHHTQAHMSLAVIEGILFNLKHIMMLLQASFKTETVYLGGGLAKFPFWAQLCADILGIRVMYGGEREDSSAGAALLGMLAFKKIKSLEDQSLFYGHEKEFLPDRRRTAIYADIFQARISHSVTG